MRGKLSLLVCICMLLMNSCGKDFSGSWYNPSGDIEMYVHNLWPGPVDFIVAGNTLRYDCLQESTQNENTYLVLQPRDERFLNDHFYVLEYSNSRSDLVTVRSYNGSAVGYTVLGERADLVFTISFTR